MKVLDATFLIDYLDAVEATKEFYEANGADTERWVVPVPAYAEVLVGEGNLPHGDVAGARADLAWTEKHAVDEHTAVTEIAYAVEQTLCKKHEIPLRNSSFTRRRKLKEAQREAQSAEDSLDQSEENNDDTESDTAPVIASDGGTLRPDENDDTDTEFDWLADDSIIESQ